MKIIEAHRGYLVLRTVSGLIVVPVVGLLFLLFFIFLVKPPWFVYLILAAIVVVVMGLVLFKLYRILSFKVEEKPVPSTPTTDRLDDYNEKVEGQIYGIMAQIRHTKGMGYVGYGEMTKNENTILLTNKRVLVITVPMEGSGVVMGGVDYTAAQNLLNKGGIAEKGRQMVANMTPQQILLFDSNNFEIRYEDITSVKIKPFWDRSVTFLTRDGKKIKYPIAKAEDIETIKSICARHMPGKLS